jgi:hypothetical protein
MSEFSARLSTNDTTSTTCDTCGSDSGACGCMTDPNTPPTVGQPPVAEMSDEDLIDDLIGWVWLLPNDYGIEEVLGDDDVERAKQVILRRLAQARSAPPSEGMVLIPSTIVGHQRTRTKHGGTPMSSDVRDEAIKAIRSTYVEYTMGTGGYDDFGTSSSLINIQNKESEAIADRLIKLGWRPPITAAASGPVEQRVMDAIDDVFDDWRGMTFMGGALGNDIKKAVRAALAPASEEGA